mmetsp:Transcript_11671/g.29140  ORF Transcript_11671/g.29140 Transcript_11671/m.29140 type:complete len:275 (+) Transcript_11671:29-853(+)|eukprot:CAMPEP_0173468726 /NCGR_PEP_ID=MMETSP1357-20121228/76953_1 /TAXON_ID=77926 /ORGANISM="Hemiselmis rufescens, Strain PCC563" /LENGTH=274 /DNA_ID=CAMNT_0014436951 /DNA_START=25 /DNA_END=849 /DNA_ORIENTATION=+
MKQQDDPPPPYAPPPGQPPVEPVPMAQPVGVVNAQPVYAQAPAYGQPQYGQPQYGQPQQFVVIQQRTGGGSKCCIAVAVGICVFIGVGFIAAGGALMGVGTSQKEELTTLDAEVDFALLPSKCKIVDMEHCWHTEWGDEGSGSSKRRKPRCFDEYQPFFEYEGGGTLAGEKSRTERNQNDCGGGCKDVTTGLKFSIGEETKCWQTTSNGKSGTSGVYYCENDPCIKIWDPQFDIDSREASSMVLVIIGAVLLGLGLVGTLSTLLCGFCCWKQAT